MSAGDAGSTSKPSKSPQAFRTISEVATELGVPQHVLRFWETKFSVVRPMKRGGGRRYYRPEDVDVLRQIQALLYTDGYTIKGVQRLLKQPGGLKARGDTPTPAEATADGQEPATVPQAEPQPSQHEDLASLRSDLVAIRDLLARTG